MKTKPWPIVILAIIQMFAPVSNVLFSAWLHHVSVSKYLTLFFQTRDTLELVEFFCLYPATAFAIYSVKNWSYPVFVSAMAWTFYRNFQSWQSHPDIFTLPLMLGVHVFNLVFVSYFLLPAVRAAYFNPRLRWWESKPRYRIDLSGHVSKEKSQQLGSECHILDISEGGVLIKTATAFEMDAKVQLKFSFFNLHFDLPAQVVHQGGAEFQGCGLRFVGLNKDQQRRIRNLTRAFNLIGLQERSQRPKWNQDLIQWATQLFTTGKGLIPQVPITSKVNGPAGKSDTSNSDSDSSSGRKAA